MLDGHKSACVSKDGVHYWFRKKELGQMKALGFRVYEIQAPVLWRSRVTEQVVYDATKVKKRRWVRWDGFGV